MCLFICWQDLGQKGLVYLDAATAAAASDAESSSSKSQNSNSIVAHQQQQQQLTQQRLKQEQQQQSRGQLNTQHSNQNSSSSMSPARIDGKDIAWSEYYLCETVINECDQHGLSIVPILSAFQCSASKYSLLREETLISTLERMVYYS